MECEMAESVHLIQDSVAQFQEPITTDKVNDYNDYSDAKNDIFQSNLTPIFNTYQHIVYDEVTESASNGGEPSLEIVNNVTSVSAFPSSILLPPVSSSVPVPESIDLSTKPIIAAFLQDDPPKYWPMSQLNALQSSSQTLLCEQPQEDKHLHQTSNLSGECNKISNKEDKVEEETYEEEYFESGVKFVEKLLSDSPAESLLERCDTSQKEDDFQDGVKLVKKSITDFYKQYFPDAFREKGEQALQQNFSLLNEDTSEKPYQSSLSPEILEEKKRFQEMVMDSSASSPITPMLYVNNKSSEVTNPLHAYKQSQRFEDTNRMNIQENETGWDPLTFEAFQCIGYPTKADDIFAAYLHSLDIKRFYKLGILYASFNDSKDNTSTQVFKEWIYWKFKLNELNNETSSTHKNLQSEFSKGRNLVYVEAMEVSNSDEQDIPGFIRGLKGIILCCQPDTFQENNWDRFVTWFKKITNKIIVPLPIIIIFWGKELPRIASDFFKRFKQGSAFTQIKVLRMLAPVNYNDYIKASKELCDAIRYLILHPEPPPELYVTSFYSFLSETVFTIFEVASYFSTSASPVENCSNKPKLIVEYFNTALNVCAQALNTRLLNLLTNFWPCKEYQNVGKSSKFIDMKYQRECLTLIADLTLPPIEVDVTNDVQYVKAYLQAVTKCYPYEARLLLTNVSIHLKNKRNWTWAVIVHECFQHVIRNFNHIYGEAGTRLVYYTKLDCQKINLVEVFYKHLRDYRERQPKRDQNIFNILDRSRTQRFYVDNSSRSHSQELQMDLSPSFQSQFTTNDTKHHDVILTSCSSPRQTCTSAVVEDLNLNNMEAVQHVRDYINKEKSQCDQFTKRINDSLNDVDINTGKHSQERQADMSTSSIFKFSNSTSDNVKDHDCNLAACSCPKQTYTSTVLEGSKNKNSHTSFSEIMKSFFDLKYNMERNKNLEKESEVMHNPITTAILEQYHKWNS